MDKIIDVFVSWQFLLVGLVVFFIMYGAAWAGHYLWRFRWLRKFLKVTYAMTPWLPAVLGGAIGAIPGCPMPEPLADVRLVARIMLMAVAGLLCQVIFKGVKQALEARGIDVKLDMPGKKQVDGTRFGV